MAGLPVTAGTGGSGLNVAGDIVGTASAPTTGDRIQYVKLDLGATGSSFPIAAGQALAANSLPVVLPATQITSLSTPVLGAGTAVIGKATTDLTTPGTTNQVASRTNAYRNGGVLHRNAITSVDKLATVGTVTLSGGTGGSLVSGTTYYVSASAYNRWGNATPAGVVNATPGGSNNRNERGIRTSH